METQFLFLRQLAVSDLRTSLNINDVFAEVFWLNEISCKTNGIVVSKWIFELSVWIQAMRYDVLVGEVLQRCRQKRFNGKTKVNRGEETQLTSFPYSVLMTPPNSCGLDGS